MCGWSVDTIGQSGVQLFVDAGRPVDGALVTALVREVLAEKISAMFAERRELEHTASQHRRSRPAVYSDTLLVSSECVVWHFFDDTDIGLQTEEY